MRWLLSLGLALLAAAACAAGLGTIPFSGAPGGLTFSQVKIGGGGFVTDISIASDGSMWVLRDDVYGAYYRTASGAAWQQVITSTSMPAGSSTVYDSQLGNSDKAVYEIRFAPSLPTTGYVVYPGGPNYNSIVYKTTDGFRTLSKLTNFTAVLMSVASNGRLYGPKMAIDPANPSHVILGDSAGLFYRTTDGGTTWAQITGIPATSLSDPVVAFDPNSSVVGSITQTVYIAWGAGTNRIYRSTTGGGSSTYSQMTGGPNTARRMVVASTGTLYLTDNDGTAANNAWKLVGTAWTQLSAASGSTTGWYDVAVNPCTPTQLTLIYEAGNINTSTDSGSTWLGYYGNAAKRIATDVSWLAFANEKSMSAGNGAYDPGTCGRLWFAEGAGIWYTTPPSDASQPTWTSQTAGNEELIVNQVVWPPGGYPLLAVQDRQLFRITDPTVYPAIHANYCSAVTNAQTLSSSAVLHFASVPSCVGISGQGYANVTTPGSLDNSGSITASDATSVTMSVNAVSTVASGDRIYFDICAIQHGWSADYATSDPTFLVRLANAGNCADQSGSSSDGGVTWTKFSGTPPIAGFGGSISAASSSAIVWIPAQNDVPQVTANGGSTWTSPTFPSAVNPQTSSTSQTIGTGNFTFTVPAGQSVSFTAGQPIQVWQTGTQANLMAGTITSYSGTTLVVNITSTQGSGTFSAWTMLMKNTGWGFTQYALRQNVCADRVNSGTFYAYNYTFGLYKSTDGGATWAQQNSGTLLTGGNDQLFNLGCVPGFAGHLFASAGTSGSSHPYNVALHRSCDGGATWSDDANTQEVWTVGFGKAAPGKSYVAVYIAGYANGDTTAGLYRGDLTGTICASAITWSRLTGAPYGSIDQITSITGDINTYGPIYFGNGGSGAGYARLN